MQSHTRRLAASLAAVALAALGASARAANVDVNPAFPAYGVEVLVQLNSNVGAAPYLPATRYRREGATISFDMEHIRGGVFGFRSDMGFEPTSLGELAPGSYTVQARLSDIGAPDAPPFLFTQAIDVAAPDASGVYAVPRNPGAYEAAQLVVRAEGPIDASSLHATVSGSSIRVDFNFTSDASARPYAVVAIPGLSPGLYRAEAFGSYPTISQPPRRYASDFIVKGTTTVVEYYSERLEHYFISAWPDEVAALDAGVAFKRTGQRFQAWLRAADAPGFATPVCRFYASGPNSHFYTSDPGECQYLKSLEQKQRADASAKGQSFPGWQFEAIAFYAVAPQGGKCPSGTTPVYRAYNNRAAENDSNHRFTASERMRHAMQQSWADEGVAFCSPA